MNQDAMFLSEIQERAANASSLLTVVTTAANTGECYCEDIGNACAVLCDYIDRTTDIIGGALEDKLRQQSGGDEDVQGQDIP
jgi:hypothetical protein